MADVRSAEVYTPREIALAAGVTEAEVLAVLEGTAARYVPHDEALRVGRLLLAARVEESAGAGPLPLFSRVIRAANRQRSPFASVPLAVSGGAHLVLLAAVATLTVGATPAAFVQPVPPRPADPVALVFLQLPGPGGGGGGGGRHQQSDPPQAMRTGHSTLNSAAPRRDPPKPIVPAVRPPEPRPLDAEPLPAVVAPIVAAPADDRTRPGVLEPSRSQADSRGPGVDGGAGSGEGTGLGEGTGAGVGAGTGGGTGGGPYRPGSGIQPPRLLREVRADYTEAARQSGIEGEVELEIVVRRDGTVGDVKVTKGLAGGLNDQAIAAVRQWRFAPATRLNAPVDVVVEVAVEFRLR
jgi:TonB family protein